MEGPILLANYSNSFISHFLTITPPTTVTSKFRTIIPISSPITAKTLTTKTTTTKIPQLFVVTLPVEHFDSGSLTQTNINSGSSITSMPSSELNDFYSVLSLFFTFVMVMMCFAGVFMNTVSLWIFTRRAFCHRSINVLLAGLSASDLCLCFLAIPVFSLNQLQKVIPGISAGISNRILIYAYPITLMAQTSSVWILVSITIDRYLAICHPFAVRIYCTTGRAIMIISCCVTFSICYNFVRFWEYTVNSEEDTVVGLLRENPYYMVLYQNIAMLLTQFILPLLVLGILNLQVAKAILEAGETRRELVMSEQREHRTAKMMLFVVIVFLFCYILSFCLNLLEIFNAELFKNSIGFLLNDVNNILVVLNSSSSFIFYTKYSSRYRSQLRIMQNDISRFICRYCFCSQPRLERDGKPINRIQNRHKSSSMTLYSGFLPTTANNSACAVPLVHCDDYSNGSTTVSDSRKNSDFAASIIHQKFSFGSKTKKLYHGRLNELKANAHNESHRDVKVAPMTKQDATNLSANSVLYEESGPTESPLRNHKFNFGFFAPSNCKTLATNYRQIPTKNNSPFRNTSSDETINAR